jgi:uncharacterized protein (DUF433 family)
MEMASELTLIAETPPLEARSGAMRIGGTRVTLDSVVCAFNQGCTANDIQRKFPTLSLAEIYAVVAYYLRHREEIDAYLAQRQAEAEELRREFEEQCPPDDVRERLLARRAQAASP